MYKGDRYSPSEILYGRRCGRPLRDQNIHLIKSHLPTWKINLDFPPPVLLKNIFSHSIDRLKIEIGFGRGKNLLQRAVEMPNVGFIGIEPFINSMVQCIRSLEELKLQNIRLYDGNAIHLLDWLPDDCIDVIYLLYPDPWTKKKHWKRRFISPINLERFSRVLKKDGVFYFSSDIDDYINWTLFHFNRHSSFQWIAKDSSDWLTPFHGWIPTYYEEKAKVAGRITNYLTFKRI